MLKHGDIWAAIDALARDCGLTASALARRAGLDPTTFNRSKRLTPEGKPRWPSTESIAKILEATGSTLTAFVAHIEPDGARPPGRRIPLIALARAGDRGLFDALGHPAPGGWDEIVFLGLDDPAGYAIEVTGDSLEPLYRDGDVLVVSPASGVRRGDRVVAATTSGEVTVRQLVRQSARRIELASPGGLHSSREHAAEEIAWMARIVWASQ